MEFRERLAEIIATNTGKVKEQILHLLEVPPNPEMGDFAFPCFSLSKELKKSPAEISKELSGKIKSDFINKVISEGPYLNFKLKNDVYAESIINSKIQVKKTGRKVMVEFSQPNTHKEFHIGHLRNASLGDSIVRISRFNGNEAIPVNYIGDIGTHVAKTLWCLDNFHKGESIKENRGKYLGKIYVEASKLVEEDEKNKEEVSQILQDLEARKPDITRRWIETREWSLDEFKMIYRDLGIVFDKYYFESEEDKPGKEISLKLLEDGIAESSEGAVIVNLEEYNLGIALILKSDGTTLYLTKDLSLGQKKFKDYGIDESIYVIDSRQSMHMKQVFKILELMGFNKKMVHVSYEFVSTAEGPISSRKGNVYLYEDLKKRLVEKVKEETKKRHTDWTDEKIEKTSNLITLSALKYGMLKMENNKEIVFDEDKWLDFEGETGPYILYTYARLCSIDRKAQKKSSVVDYSKLSTSEDKNLLRLMEQEKSVIEEAGRNYKPSLLARFVLDLSQKVNEYYHKHQVLKEEMFTRNARLKLFEKAREIIKRDLLLLGIEAPDEM